MRDKKFVCDDRAGYEFRILQANDGDFHLSIVPNIEDAEREHINTEHFQWSSVRVRMPMIGGGAHPALWHALASLFAEVSDKDRIDKMEAKVNGTGESLAFGGVCYWSLDIQRGRYGKPRKLGEGGDLREAIDDAIDKGAL